jgi:hypothetical protein
MAATGSAVGMCLPMDCQLYDQNPKCRGCPSAALAMLAGSRTPLPGAFLDEDLSYTVTVRNCVAQAHLAADR